MKRKTNRLRTTREDVFSDIPRTVLLLGGPYSGQDIRATTEELQAGVIVRGADMYVASTEKEPAVKSRLPLFLWLQQVKIALFPLMTMPYAI